MNRRGFLLGAGGILASAVAPAIVRADSLMRIVPMETIILRRPFRLIWVPAGYETVAKALLYADYGDTIAILPLVSHGRENGPFSFSDQ